MKRKILWVILIILLFTNIPVSRANLSKESLNEGKGKWITNKDYVIISENDGDYLNSFSFSANNITGWMNFDFELILPMNFSQKFLAIRLKVENTDLEIPLRLTLVDANKQNRGFLDVKNKFAIVSNDWNNIIFDLNNFQWEDSDFEISQIEKIKFTSYNNGNPYSQKVWLENLELLYDEQNQNTISSSMKNTLDFSIISGVLLLLFTCFCVGFIFFNFLKPNLLTNGLFLLASPLYIITGLIILIVLLASFCLIYFDVITSYILLSVIFIVFAFVIKQKWRDIRLAICNSRKVELFIPILLLVLSIFLFLRLSIDIGWGAYVDSQTHGLFTSLILFYKRFPSSSFPVGNLPINPIRYPMGFHAISAFISLITGVYPGKAILITATVLVSIIPSLLYFIVKMFTNSSKLSFLAFLLTFFLPANTVTLWRPSNDLLFSNFLSGIYPNLLGNVIIICLMVFVILRRKAHFSVYADVLIYGLLAIGLFFGYYSLLPFFFFFIFLHAIMVAFGRLHWNLKSGLIIFVLFSIITMFLTLITYKDVLINFFNLNSSLLYDIYMRYPLFDFDSPYIFYTFAIFTAFPFSLWFLTKNNLKEISLLFLSFFVPLIAAQNKQLYVNLFWFIQPDRVLILLVIFSYILIILGVYELWKLDTISETVKKLHLLIFSKYKLKPIWIAMSIITVLLLPSLVTFFTYSYPNQYKSLLPNGNDYRAFEWMVENSSGLILNDKTVMGLWASSFKAMELINDREIILEIYLFNSLNDTILANRIYESNEILDYPYDYSRTAEIVEKYNISYIYLSENDNVIYERGQPILPLLPTQISQVERIMMYQLNPNLEIVFRSGKAIIFKVN